MSVSTDDSLPDLIPLDRSEGVDPHLALATQLVRGADDSCIREGMNAVFQMGSMDALEDLVVLTFHTRDIRCGKGERLLFYQMMRVLVEAYPTLVVSLLDLIPIYGCWKDFFALATRHEVLHTPSLVISKMAIEADEIARMNGEKITLFAKWAPKQGKKMAVYANALAEYLCPASENPGVPHSTKMAMYRRRISSLNATLRTVQTYMCAGRWDEIEPNRVPAVERKKGVAGYMNEMTKRKDGTQPTGIRYPANEKRMACRAKFQEFFRMGPQTNMTRLDDTRYNYVRQRVRAWYHEQA